MKFAMFSDLHYDAIPDGNRRIEDFITCVKKAEAEFIVDLGDLCYPLNENNQILNELKSSGLPCYFTIGNHNTDKFTIGEVIKFFNLKKSYYSFIKDNIVPYYKRNYVKTTDNYPYIPDEEIKWLKKELEDNEKYFIIISHQSLTNDFQNRGISNREEIRTILEEKNLNGRKVLFCINGHYQKHSPKDIGIGTIWNGVSIEAKTPSVYIKMKR